ncbi:MAG: hypothetical protein KatS3mg068_0630 [Candidatus Sericytochromatia bacterium]|nr:MAG: hypothetical protein KatS3mg068_0630 [Candidatus Sericytochromatia bacterium]
MNNLKDLISFFNDKKTELENVINDKDLLIIFFEILNSINFLDSNYINQLKNNNRNLFLFFVANIKSFLDKLIDYLEIITPEIKSFYTQSLVQEIENMKNKINELKNQLFDNELLLKEKDYIKKEYERYIFLINKKNELLEQKKTLDKVNLDEVNSECNKILEQINYINNNIQKLEEQKINYKNKLIKNKEIENQLIELKKQYEDSNEFLFEKFLSLIENFKNNINDKKNFYSEQLELSIKLLKEKDKELKIFANEINKKKEFFKNKIEIINNHFITNKEIICNIKDLDKEIHKKIGYVEKYLLEIDNDLSKYLNYIRKITNKN